VHDLQHVAVGEHERGKRGAIAQDLAVVLHHDDARIELQ
jgi:hypothetical protein